MLERLKQCLKLEAEAIGQYARVCGSELSDAVDTICRHSGLLIVVGVGKSGHIARKVASTFCSLGRPSYFLHPTEAAHGDLGIFQKNSLVLVFSNSGESSELFYVLKYCREHQIKLIAVTALKTSTLANSADITLDYGIVDEICPNRLAPTTSTTLSLAIGDALAAGFALQSGMSREKFFDLHPTGSLKAKFLTLGEMMHTGDKLPLVVPEANIQEVVIEITKKSLGVAIVVDNGEVCGIITDGDLRRHVDHLWNAKAIEICTKTPVFLRETTLVTDALSLMKSKRITSCLVHDDSEQFLGLVHLHDCLRSGVLQ